MITPTVPHAKTPRSEGSETPARSANAQPSAPAVNAAMILFGALQEKYEQPGSGGLLPFIFGSMVGIVPWILVLIYFLRPGSASDVAAPDFVVGIVISLFVFFNTFAINQWLQYRAHGKWSNYLHGERVYIDDKRFWPIFERAQALDVPVYLHPATPHPARRPCMNSCAS